MTTPMSKVIHHLRSALLLRDGMDLTDGQLLECFVCRQETAALEALVGRHGPMVWGVCRRILRNHHDAEDAFQATFLVLVRKAASVAPREMVGNWLYGVAQQTALKARAMAAKQRTRERQAADLPDLAVNEQDISGDLQTLLDQELSRLPDKYRVAIVRCDLEGETRKEAARQLGLPEGTLAGRLTRGRAMLAKRLARHGLAVTGGSLTALLCQTAASASLPAWVFSSTIYALTLVAADKTLVAGLISAKAANLTKGVLKAMLMTKLKAVAAIVLVLGFFVTGAAILSCRTAAAQSEKPPVANEPMKQKQKNEEEAFIAWGKEVGGLQAGLGLRSGQKRTYSYGDTVMLVVRVRNVSKEAVSFEYLRQYFQENMPAVTDATGNRVNVGRFINLLGEHIPVKVTLAPGKEIEIHELNLRPVKLRDGFLFRPDVAQSEKDPSEEFWATGKVNVQYEQVFGNSSSGNMNLNPVLAKLATGKLELDIKSTTPAEPNKKSPPQKDAKEFTAWGTEVGGLQAGLCLRPAEHRAYQQGETVTLVVRVRNVGKEPVKFEYLRQFLDENPPIVTDVAGKTVPQHRTSVLGIHAPVEVSLTPGKEIELESRLGLQFKLLPASDRGKPSGTFMPLYGSGKVSLQYERVFGKSSSGFLQLDPTLSKLATGKLELEIKSAPPAAAEPK